jgi:hypothetical protein
MNPHERFASGLQKSDEDRDEELTKPEIGIRKGAARTPAKPPEREASGIRPVNGEEPVSLEDFGEVETPVAERDVAKVWGVEDTQALDREDAAHAKQLAEQLRRMEEAVAEIDAEAAARTAAHKRARGA